MRTHVFIFCTFITSISFGQNVPRFSQFNFAQGVNNPAAIALDSKIMVDLMFRNQWFGIEGAPTSGTINGQYEIYHDMAVGLNVSYDLIGVHHATQVSGQYAYRAYLANGNAMIFGASLGFDHRVHDLPSARLNELNDPAFEELYSRTHFNAGFGMYYHASKFYMGLSIPQLFQSVESSNASGLRAKYWHYFFSTGFYIHASEKYSLNPHIQIKAAINTPIQADLILRNTFNNTWSLNVGYRSESAILAGFDFLIAGRYRFGYSFNYDVGKLAKFKGSSNELYVGIGLPYHNSREAFGQRKYLNRKQGYKRDFHKGHKQRRWYK